jgi:putative PIN family toxin of toxin-antitoxin system
MNLAVVDTNVLVSGLYYPGSLPGRVLDAVQSGLLTPVFDRRILAEYAEVLARPKFRAFFRAETAERLLIAFVRLGMSAGEVERYPAPLRDENDRAFIEVALATGVLIVTGNSSDFPAELGIEVVLPAEMVRRLGL